MLKLLALIAGTVTGIIIGIELALGREFEAAAMCVPVVMSLVAAFYFELVEPNRLG